MPLHDHLSASIGKAAAKHKAKSSGKKLRKEVDHMTIERASNGYTTKTHYKPGMEETGRYEEPELNVHKSHRDVAKHVGKVFGGGENETGEAGDEASAGKAAKGAGKRK